MSGIAEIVELVGSSEKSWADAAQVAVNEAVKTIRGVRGIDVKDLTAKVDSDTGKIREYREQVILCCRAMILPFCG
jgi:dodecin